jgi:hypothetical protein
MHVRENVGQPGVRQRELRIARCCGRQVPDCALERFGEVAVALRESGHEFAVRVRVAAISITGLRRRCGKLASQRFHDLASNLVLYLEDVIEVEVMRLGRNALLHHRIEEVHRDAPPCPESLDVPLEDVARAEVATDPRRIGPGRIAEDGRRRNDRQVVEPSEHRDQRGKAERQGFDFVDVAEKQEREHRNRRQRSRAGRGGRHRSLVSRAAAQRVQHRFGRLITFRGILPEKLLNDGAELSRQRQMLFHIYRLQIALKGGGVVAAGPEALRSATAACQVRRGSPTATSMSLWGPC